ncbi:YifB family Mg chelatase-like AAA ATPase [Candidatus Arthromitus sp. SFB-rat-Yit]|uniref:YifB family Mg chelatase-like AAA ATPase n=1 Tax=Candidatus Arthromitus sp. SFB-rat-Yit TaxID=1041504 RepID=UPI000227A76F|nr:YifB family Mg chelatase-like AAA ATPase [Candidatus Arthromitus sp. SFB-rat-Yit]BAK81159.1 Mg chelatase, subunit ChlI [Candidatus Arthromitus sp. SFB-rat-Yit]
MVISLKSATFNYIKGRIIDIEVSITKGIPSFNIVGLANVEIKESRERVRSAILNSGFKFPLGKITVNLAPANLKKEGSLLDLCIATGILICSKQINPIKNLFNTIIIGELSLDGHIKSVKGSIPIILDGKDEGYNNYVLPEDNYDETEIIQDVKLNYFNNLKSFIAYAEKGIVSNIKLKPKKRCEKDVNDINLEDILGHVSSKRAIQIAAAGFHNIILYGPVGSGKTMLAKSFKSILPDLTYEESLDKGRIYNFTSIQENYRQPVFREVSHTISKSSLIGSGRENKVGEMILGNNGVLFLDEMLEFKRETLEALRKVLEDRKIQFNKNNEIIEFPSNFILLGATNLCPCGNYLNNSAIKQCVCDVVKRERYINKISKSLLDRVDIFSYTPVIDYVDIGDKKDMRLTSEEVLKTVVKAREIQHFRFKKYGMKYNSQMNNELVNKFCKLSPSSKQILETIYRKENISTRSYFKILKIARTIADLNQSENINDGHIMEVINYRKFINNQVI